MFSDTNLLCLSELYNILLPPIKLGSSEKGFQSQGTLAEKFLEGDRGKLSLKVVSK